MKCSHAGTRFAFVAVAAAILILTTRSTRNSRVDRVPAITRNAPIGEAEKEGCVSGARQVLGTEAQLLRCGHLSGRNSLEAVAIIRPAKLADDRDGIPLTRLVVIQQADSAWGTELTVANEIRNPFGYLAFDYLDDSEPVNWFRVSFAEEGTKDFAIVLRYVSPTGVTDDEGLPYEIGWNPDVNRYQELLVNGDGFQEEKKTLPHIRTREDCRLGSCP